MIKEKGKLIVLEGTDGTGKATQADLLVERLKQKGYKVKMIDFPQYGKTIFGDTVASYLRGEFGDSVNLNPYLASLPYAADRWKASFDLKKDIEEGIIIVANRYTSASMGHQGGKIDDIEERKKFFDWLKRIEQSEEGFNIPKPDVTILLYLKPEIAQKLVEQKVAAREYSKKLDQHESDINHLRKAAAAFLEVANEENWHVIDCTDHRKNWILSKEDIQEEVWNCARFVLY